MAEVKDYPNTISSENHTISSGGTKTDEIKVYGCSLGAFELPASFDGTSISFEGSLDGTNYAPIYDSQGIAVTVPTVAVSRVYAVDPTVFHAFNFIKIVSGSTESANRTIKCGFVLI